MVWKGRELAKENTNRELDVSELEEMFTEEEMQYLTDYLEYFFSKGIARLPQQEIPDPRPGAPSLGVRLLKILQKP